MLEIILGKNHMLIFSDCKNLCLTEKTRKAEKLDSVVDFQDAISLRRLKKWWRVSDVHNWYRGKVRRGQAIQVTPKLTASRAEIPLIDSGFLWFQWIRPLLMCLTSKPHQKKAFWFRRGYNCKKTKPSEHLQLLCDLKIWSSQFRFKWTLSSSFFVLRNFDKRIMSFAWLCINCLNVCHFAQVRNSSRSSAPSNCASAPADCRSCWA